MTSCDMRTAPMNFTLSAGDNIHRLAGWSCSAELSEDLATKKK